MNHSPQRRTLLILIALSIGACGNLPDGTRCEELKAKLNACGLGQVDEGASCSTGLLARHEQVLDVDCAVLSAGKVDWINGPWDGCDEPCFVPGGVFNWFCKPNVELQGSGLKTCCQRDESYYSRQKEACGTWVPIGSKSGSMWNTYYYLTHEEDYPGTRDTVLYDESCNELTKVSAAYSDAVCVEGSGKLSSGTVINYASKCDCGRPCPTGGIVCYEKLSWWSYPWGKGSFENALEPLRSIAVDKGFIPLKSVIYLEEWNGTYIPKVDGLGGFTHDGCFRADDVGGKINDSHYDFFAGSRKMHTALEKIFPTESKFTAYHGGAHCAHLEP